MTAYTKIRWWLWIVATSVPVKLTNEKTWTIVLHKPLSDYQK